MTMLRVQTTLAARPIQHDSRFVLLFCALAACAFVTSGCAQPLLVTPTTINDSALVVVTAGPFLMGQDDGPRSNQPQHTVFLDAFAIQRTEVTNAAFARFVQETGYAAVGWKSSALEDRTNEPVAGVLWRDADAYCRWAGLRLPTEAEWEKAARGVDGRIFPWGDAWNPTHANTAESGVGQPMAVGSYPAGASPYGALDMAGNVAEWVADTFAFDYYTYAPDHNPRGPEKVMDHGLRGGSWAAPLEYAQTFRRDSSHSARPNPRVGFRCARSWPAQ
jgi:iron(II)-dependent oxidoreductase